MKTLRQICVVVVFTLALTASAFAGEIEITKTSPPPPPTVQGDIHTTVTGQAETGSSEATEIALNLLQSVLALF
jgi:hypothetical protein